MVGIMKTHLAQGIGLLPSEAIVLDARPSPRVIWVWLFAKSLPTALMIALLAFIAWTIANAPAEPGGPHPHTSVQGFFFVAASFVLALIAAQACNRALVRTCVYRVTSQRFMFSGGILFKTTHAVEHRRVTDVQFTQNPLEQALSLACVNLSTPGTVRGGRERSLRQAAADQRSIVVKGRTYFVNEALYARARGSELAFGVGCTLLIGLVALARRRGPT